MPWYFWITVVIGLLATIAGILIPFSSDESNYNDDPTPRTRVRWAAFGLAGVTAVLTLLSSVTFIPANEVGLVTNFGAWSGTKTSGISITAPWSKVDTFGTRNQKSIRDAADTEGSADCVKVKMDGGSTGCQDLTVLYTIEESNAKKLWEGWKDFDKLNVDLINRQTDDSVLAVFPKYTPLDAQGSKRGEITTQLTEELRNRLAPQGVRLESITLGTLNLPKETQDNLNQLVNKDTQLQIALKGEEQAKAEARTNEARQKSLTPEALVMECLNTVREVRPQVMPSCGLGAKSDAGTLVSIGPRQN